MPQVTLNYSIFFFTWQDRLPPPKNPLEGLALSRLDPV